MEKKEWSTADKNSAANNLVELIMDIEKRLVNSNEKKFDADTVNKIAHCLEEVYKLYETEETNNS